MRQRVLSGFCSPLIDLLLIHNLCAGTRFHYLMRWILGTIIERFRQPADASRPNSAPIGTESSGK